MSCCVKHSHTRATPCPLHHLSSLQVAPTRRDAGALALIHPEEIPMLSGSCWSHSHCSVPDSRRHASRTPCSSLRQPRSRTHPTAAGGSPCATRSPPVQRAPEIINAVGAGRRSRTDCSNFRPPETNHPESWERIESTTRFRSASRQTEQGWPSHRHWPALLAADHLGFEVPRRRHEQCHQHLRAAYVKPRRPQVSLLPSLLAGISNDPALLLDDGIHPNAAAQARVLDNAWPTLRPLLLP